MVKNKDTASAFTCPECHGTLFTMPRETVPHYECRVGHTYSVSTLGSNQLENLETAFWVALRTIEEHRAYAREHPARDQDAYKSEARRAQSKLKVVESYAKVLQGWLGKQNQWK